MSKLFVTSDTHFGHNNILRYANRPFKTVEEMNEHLVKIWNSRVSPEDSVYFLGDFAMGPEVDDAFILHYLSLLNGSIKFLPGNHDMGFRKRGKPRIKKVKKLILENNLPITPIPEATELILGCRRFVLSHYPTLRSGNWGFNRDNKIHLHGHSHSEYLVGTYLEGKRKFDIGVDMYGGPVELTEDLKYLINPTGWNTEAYNKISYV